LKRYIQFACDSFEVNSIAAQLEQKRFYKENLTQKQSLASREVRIETKRFKNDKSLNRKGALSKKILEQSEEKYIKSKQKLLELKSEQILCEEKIIVLSTQLEEVNRNNIKSYSQLNNQFRYSLLNLKSMMDIYEKSYHQKAPFNGVVNYYNLWDNSQYVSKGTNIAFVSNMNKHVKAHLNLSGDGFGKVKKGQKVKIALDSYSAVKYGFVTGEVESISEININNVYALVIKLPEGLKTDYKFKLKFMPNLNGTGEVITENISIMERLFKKLMDTIRNKTLNKKLDNAI
jgi:HlyD family secretion protein